MRVGIYARVSVDRDGESTSVERQLESCRQLAASRGWTVVAEYSDSDLSAFRRGVVRPGYDAMLANLDNLDTILVWKLDRLVRRFLEFARIWPILERHGVALVSANEPIDTSSAIGRIIVLMLVGFAELESETISLRTRARHDQLRQAGHWSGGGRRAFGLTADWTDTVDDEAALVREAARRITARESLRSIARDWEARGILTPAGTPWSPSHLRRAMRSPRLVGRRRGQKAAEGNIPAILTTEEFDAVQAVLAPRAGGPGQIRSYLLSGLVWCARCDVKTESNRKSTGQRRYRCPRCFLSISADYLEGLIAEGVLERVESPAVAFALDRRTSGSPAGKALAAAIAEDESALVALTRARYVERLLTDDEFRSSRDELVSRIAKQRTLLEQQAGPGVLREAQGKARPLWEGADLGWRRALVEAVVDRVTILPATKPVLDPGRVEVVLRA